MLAFINLWLREIILLIICAILLLFVLRKRGDSERESVFHVNQLLLSFLLAGAILILLFPYNIPSMLFLKIGLLSFIALIIIIFRFGTNDIKKLMWLISYLCFAFILLIAGSSAYKNNIKTSDTCSRQEVVEYEYKSKIDLDKIPWDRSFYYRLNTEEQTVRFFIFEEDDMNKEILLSSDVKFDYMSKNEKKLYKTIRYYDSVNYNHIPPVIIKKETSSSTTYELKVIEK